MLKKRLKQISYEIISTTILTIWGIILKSILEPYLKTEQMNKIVLDIVNFLPFLFLGLGILISLLFFFYRMFDKIFLKQKYIKYKIDRPYYINLGASSPSWQQSDLEKIFDKEELHTLEKMGLVKAKYIPL